MYRFGNNIFIKIAVVCIAVFCIFSIVRLQIKNNDVENQIQEASDRLDELNDKTADARRQMEEPFDDEYVADEARKKLNYHLPEEIIFYNGD